MLLKPSLESRVEVNLVVNNLRNPFNLVVTMFKKIRKELPLPYRLARQW